MAGIGFELRKMLKRDSLLGLLRAYTYAGIISSGPWILSIVGILLIGILSLPFVIPGSLITQFQVSVTYLIAVSLILTGPMQLAFTASPPTACSRSAMTSCCPTTTRCRSSSRCSRAGWGCWWCCSGFRSSRPFIGS
jgi:hypothetical protein